MRKAAPAPRRCIGEALEAQKAAWDNGFRLERGVESGGWLRYGSTTARGEIWIAGVPPRGPWLLSIDHPGVAAELATLQSSGVAASISRGILRCDRASGDPVEKQVISAISPTLSGRTRLSVPPLPKPLLRLSL